MQECTDDKCRGRHAYIEDVGGKIPGETDVYLVPGTWGAGIRKTLFAHWLNGNHNRARNNLIWPSADWTERDSSFVREAEKKLPDARIRRLVWGARNRSSDRENASAALRDEIKVDSKRPKLIISHSHGGNAVLDAVSEYSCGVRGVVTLNTPFFSSLRRNTMNTLAAGAFSLAFGFWICFYLFDEKHFFLMTLGGIGIVVVLLAILNESKWSKNKENLFITPSHVQTPFLCLTTYEDEAFAVLNFVDAIANIPFLLVGKWSPWIFALVLTIVVICGGLPVPFEWGTGPLEYTSWVTWLGLGLVVIMLAGLICLPTKKWNLPGFFFVCSLCLSPWLLSLLGLGWGLVILYVFTVFAWSGFAVLCLIALTLPAILVSDFLAQGNWRLEKPYFVRSVVTLTPLTAQRVKFVPFQPTDAKDINHSMLHGDAPRTWDEIMKWHSKV